MNNKFDSILDNLTIPLLVNFQSWFNHCDIVIEDFKNFLVNPTSVSQDHKNKNYRFILYSIVWLVVLDLVFSITAAIFATIVSQLVLHSLPISKLDQLTDFKLFIKGVFVAPATEEIFFRTMISSNLFEFLLGSIIYTWFMVREASIYTIAFLIFPLLITIQLIWKSTSIRIKSLFNILIYMEALSFGLIHMNNFTTKMPLYIAILFVIPQIGGGFTLTYCRYKFGLKYSIFMHMLFNFVPFSVVAILKPLIS